MVQFSLARQPQSPVVGSHKADLGAYMELYREIGSSFEAVAKEV
jgi:hypothetical protein